MIMGVKINVDSSQDYSYLFQSLSSGGMGNLNFLSDYSSIKNGSYGKLMKAYYGTGQSSSTSSGGRKGSTYNILEKLEAEKRNPKVSKDVQEANSKLKSGLSTLKNSISTLQNDATYSDTENGKTAADKVVSAVKSFVSNYNDVVTASKGSTLTSQTAYVANMMSTTAASADQLAEIGIKVNAKGTLEINEAKLKAADISKVQELFSSEEVMSYGSRLASRVQFAGSAAEFLFGLCHKAKKNLLQNRRFAALDKNDDQGKERKDNQHAVPICRQKRNNFHVAFSFQPTTEQADSGTQPSPSM